MKATKFIVLAGGILGILAFFLPMANVHRGDYSATVSAFQLVKGIDTLAVQAGHDMKVAVDTASIEGAAQARSALDGMKGIVLGLFIPGFLLAALGALAFMRGKFERVAATFSFVAGLVALGLGVLLRGASEGDGGIALTLLVVTGLAGAIGGIIGLVKPDRGVARQTTRSLVAVPA
ncbi:MAG TPA: hypothetical protein VGM90_37530 [Kofleriaceae bacterium]|jgi:hypothetical protein